MDTATDTMTPATRFDQVNGTVHLATSNRHGMTTFCTGRTMRMMVGTSAPVTCRSCTKKAAANGVDVNG